MAPIKNYQCIAITTKNKRCRLNILEGNSMCYRHAGILKQGREVTTIFHDNYNHVFDFFQKTRERKVKNIFPDCHNAPINVVNIHNNVKPFVQFVPLILTDDNECQCCFDSFTKEETITCTGASEEHVHTFCKDCVKGYLENVMNDKKSICCMMSGEGCEGRYRDKDIAISLNDKQYERYQDYMEVDDATSLAKTLDNYNICPFCSKFGVIVDNIPGHEDQHIIKIDCPMCKKTWCIKCRKESHGNDPCGKINTDDKDVIRKLVDMTIDDAVIHNCPKCYTKYNKIDGCNLMTCPSCHTYSCYLCGLLIVKKRGVKYWHFKGSGSADRNAICPLYNDGQSGLLGLIGVRNGNQEYNNKKVIKALHNLIDINYGNKSVTDGILLEIISRGYSKKEFNKSNKIWSFCTII